MLLQNNICNIKITIDETYTLDSTDNKPYDVILNPHHFKRKNRYKTFSIQINLFYEVICVALVGDFYSYATDCAVLDHEILTILQNKTIV